MRRLKFAICLAVAALGGGAFSVRYAPEISGQTRVGSLQNARDRAPNVASIDRLDHAVQRRFLTEPFFGIRRIEPTTPEPLESIHVGSFSARTDEERAIVSGIGKDGWLSAIYLFGRRATPRGDKTNPYRKFDIRYRVNLPVPVTPELERDKLPKSKKLIDDVKKAFARFQSAPAADPAEYRFAQGKWEFVAKPVRAVNQSCVSCHTDWVVNADLGDGRYEFRQRKIGDVNGVIVYGFSKKDSK